MRAVGLGLSLLGMILAAALKLPGGTRSSVLESYGNLPLIFEANDGQTDSRVKFLSRERGYTLFLTATEAVLARDGSAVRMKFNGANPAPRITGADPLAGKRSYFIGSDPRKWRTAIPTYGKVRYESLYPGVDLVFRGSQGRLEYDFLIAPGADPGAIRLSFEGAQALALNEKGDVLVHADNGTILHQRPVVWQELKGAKKEVAGRFVLSGNELAFEVSGRDPEAPLVIDPAIVYSSYLGGKETDRAYAVAVDPDGNAYVTGYTDSVDFPTTAGALQSTNAGTGPGTGQNAFVAKIDPTGTILVYSTYLGGASARGQDIVVDAAGNAYVAGVAGSNFPTTPGALYTSRPGLFGAGFLTKLDPTGGALVYSTYLPADEVAGIAVDTDGNTYVSGDASPPDFRTTPGAFQTAFAGGDWDAFVTKVNASGTGLLYSTYLGGSGNDRGGAIAVDSAGNAYLTGTTASGNFPTTRGAFQTAYRGNTDAFVAKLNPAGAALVYSTYLGGSSQEEVNTSPSISVDFGGSAYVTGCTFSANFPTTPGAFQTASGGSGDAFISKLDSSGGALVYSTYLGGSGTDYATDIAVDSAGNAYVAGSAGGRFPTTPGTLRTCPWTDPAQPGVSYGCDAFLSKLNSSGSALVYSTGLMRLGLDGIAVDRVGNAYLTGRTESLDTTPGVFQTTFGGGMSDAFIAKFELPATPTQAPSISAGGVVDAATFGTRLAAGSVAALFGSNLAASTIVADGVPLPATLGDVTVRLNGVPAPLFFVSPSQINFLVPWELEGQTRASVTVTVGGAASGEQSVNLSAYAPGIFSMNQRGTGQGAILMALSGEMAAAPGSVLGRTSRPARRGEYVSIFCTGLGAVTNQPVSGGPGPSSPLAATTSTPAVTIGGASATVSFSGLAPGFVGLYQVNAQVPATALTGNAVPVVIGIGGFTSNTVTMAVAGDGAGTLTAPRPIAPVDNATIRQNDPASGCTADLSKGAGYRIRFEWSAPPAGEQVAGYELWAARGTAAPLLNAPVPSQPTYALQRCGEFIADDSLEGWEWRVRARDATGNLSPWSATARFRFEPCRLADGRPCGSPVVGSFAATGSMTTPRAGHTATLLASGRVLIAGGFNWSTGLPKEIGTAELFDPQTGRFTATGSLRMARVRHQATLLADGRVLITGGSVGGFMVALSSAEIYDPVSGQFNLVGSMTEPRTAHAAARLADGRVLIAGGIPPGVTAPSPTAEIFNPATATFTRTGSMVFGRGSHTASLLPSGRVLIVGHTALAELYDPARGSFSLAAAAVGEARAGHTATVLPNGQVLIAGGTPQSNVKVAELYDPPTNTFMPAGAMTTARWLSAAALLRNGWVLITGGRPLSYLPPMNSAERFIPADRAFLSLPAMLSARADHTATLLADGRVLIVGGEQVAGTATLILPSAELFTLGP